MSRFNIIVCTDNTLGIGKNNTIPWKLSPDLKRFSQITKSCSDGAQNSIIMGRKTWDSLPRKPLPDRLNIIVSRTLEKVDGAIVAPSLDHALLAGKECEKQFVIGGGQLYEEAIKDPRCHWIHLTQIKCTFDCDIYFPPLNDQYRLIESEGLVHEGLNYVNQLYIRQNKDELNYLDLLQEVLDEGIVKDDRTGVGIVSTFGKSLSFDLKKGFPLLTSKFVPFKLTTKELLWFISGSTDNAVLRAQKVGIWNGNTTPEFLEKMRLPYEENDLGPMYGFQWRYAGAKYVDCKTNYKGQGVDQLARVIKTIKEDPGSRRIILSAYNVADLDKMVLNPCHCMVQFYVDTVRGELSAQMYQRSADLFLGVPINIASYALLTHLIAHVCKLGVGKLTICYGDAHIYKNHLEQVKEQLSRRDRVKPFPELKILRVIDNIEDFTLDDIAIVGYEHEARIKAPMAV